MGDPRSERGGALLELAVCIPIFVVLMALIFDIGLGFSAARDSSSAARSGARVAALAGNERLADYRAIDAVRAEYAASDDDVVWMTVYRSSPGGTGLVPTACQPGGSGAAGVCNVYDSTAITTLTDAQFASDGCSGEPDANWCPTDRRDDEGDYLGVAVWTIHNPTVGLLVPRSSGEGPAQLGDGGVELEDRAVFALYFPDDDS
ncbi:MAG: TadE/TadG family type IV pilus assembly protein [Actinomycetota bacterium]